MSASSIHKIWEAVLALDGMCLQAHAHMAAAAVAAVLQVRDAGTGDLCELTAQALLLCKAGLSSCDAFSECVPRRWAATDAQYESRVRAALELNMGLVLDFCCHLPDDAISHYEAAARLDGSDRRVWQLWASCAARDPSLADDDARYAATSAVHQLAVHRGLWLRVDQRPLQLLPELASGAMPWHDARAHPICRTLETHFAKIKAEGIALLHAHTSPFIDNRNAASARGLALLSSPPSGLAASITRRHEGANEVASPTGGEGVAVRRSHGWRDVSLYVNGRRHDTNAVLAPFTTALLGGDEGGMLMDGSSCPYGSAFFSLLEAGARLRPHCGPTNARLRAHLPLVVPAGDCAMRVGSWPARSWAEGEVSCAHTHVQMDCKACGRGRAWFVGYLRTPDCVGRFHSSPRVLTGVSL